MQEDLKRQLADIDGHLLNIDRMMNKEVMNHALDPIDDKLLN